MFAGLLDIKSEDIMSYFEDRDRMGRVVGRLRPEFLKVLQTVEIAQEFPGLSQHCRVSYEYVSFQLTVYI